MQCGKVTLPPNSPLLTQSSGQNTGYQDNGPFGSPFGTGPVYPGIVPPPYWQWQGHPFFSSQFNTGTFHGRGTQKTGGPDDESSKGQPSLNQKPSREWNANPKKATGLPSNVDFIGRSANPAKAQQAVFTDTETKVKTKDETDVSQGQTIGYIVGGCGAALAAICAIAIVLIYSRRKKQYIRHRDVHPIASFRNSGRRRVEIDMDSVYTTPAEVDERRHRLSTQNNAAYVSDLPERSRPRSELNTDGYSTVGLASRDQIEEAEAVNARQVVGHDYDNNFRR